MNPALRTPINLNRNIKVAVLRIKTFAGASAAGILFLILLRKLLLRALYFSQYKLKSHIIIEEYASQNQKTIAQLKEKSIWRMQITETEKLLPK